MTGPPRPPPGPVLWIRRALGPPGPGPRKRPATPRSTADSPVPPRRSRRDFAGARPAARLLPPLATVRTDFAEIGARSLRLLLGRLEGAAEPRSAPVDPVVPVELVVRRGTGPAPGRDAAITGPAARDTPPDGSSGVFITFWALTCGI